MRLGRAFLPSVCVRTVPEAYEVGIRGRTDLVAGSWVLSRLQFHHSFSSCLGGRHIIAVAINA